MTRLSGWGGNLRADCVLREPELPGEVAAALDRAGTIARGLGRSYGDAALNGGGQVLGLRRVDRYLAFDAEAGVLTCEAGASLEQIIRGAFSDFGRLQAAIEARGIAVQSAESEYVAQNLISLPEDKSTEVMELVDALEQDEDVQRVFHNLG